MIHCGRPSVLLTGDWHRCEFREATSLLRERTDLTAVATAEDAVVLLQRSLEQVDPWPDVIVLAQARPGRFSSADISNLKRLAPLARVFGILGSWCEGEARTGSPWPAVDRCSWYDWVPRFATDLDRCMQGLCPGWGLPETASSEEHTLWAAGQPLARRTGRVGIWSPCTETMDAVGDACRLAGYMPEFLDPGGNVGNRRSVWPAIRNPLIAAVWEGTQCDTREAAMLARFCAQLDGIPVVVLLDFPRSDACIRAARAGAAQVMGKPLRVGDLLFRLDQVVGGNGTPGSRPDDSQQRAFG